MRGKICFFSGDITRSGGTERVATRLANALEEDGSYEICIVSLVEKEKEVFFKLNDSIKRYHLGTKWINPGPGYLPLIWKLRKFLKEQKINVIVDIDIVLDVLAIPATKGLGVKVISWEHFNCEYEQKVFYRKLISKLTSKSADYIITLTKEDKEDYERILHRKKPIKAIYNMVAKMNYSDQIQRKPWIITVGRLTDQKGIDHLIQVAKEVLPANPDWKWLLLGDGEEREKLETAIKTYHLEDQLILKGKVEDVSWYLNRAQLMVLTSKYEGFGMCLVEALKMRVPCVSFDIKIGPSEIIADGINGILIASFDHQEMINAICELLEDSVKRDQMAERTQIDFERFEDHKIVAQWKHVFEEVLNN